MSSKGAHPVWLKAKLFGVLMILITLPANDGVAQYKTINYLNSFRQGTLVIKDVSQQELTTSLDLGVNYNARRGIAVDISRRNINSLIRSDISGFEVSGKKNNLNYLSPFSGSRDSNEDVSTLLNTKKFNLVAILYYDKQVDNFDFSLKGQVKLSSRIFVQMAFFIFHVPRPRFLGASKTSSVSLYELQWSFRLH